MFIIRLLSLMVALFMVPCPAVALSLPEAEAQISRGFDVLKAAEDLSAAHMALEAVRERSGLSLFGDLSARGINEPLSRSDSSGIEGYQSYSVRLGARLPLFGSWHKERIAILEARLGELEAEQRLQLVHRANLTALRKAFVSLWTARRRREVCLAFLGLRDRFMPIMDLRVAQGFLLESDRREMDSWFLLAQRELAASQLVEDAAVQLIRRACGILDPSPAGLDDGVPPLKPLAMPFDEAAARAIESAGDLKPLQEALEVRRSLVGHRARGQYDSFLYGGFQLTKESPGRYGAEGFLSLSFLFPEGESRAALLDAQAERHRVKSLEAQANARRLEVQSSLAEALSAYRYAETQAEFSLGRLRAASEAVRVATLRHGAMPGDTAERLLRAHVDLMNAALGLIDAEGSAAQSHAELLSLMEGRISPVSDSSKALAVTPLRTFKEGKSLLSLWLDRLDGLTPSSPAASNDAAGGTNPLGMTLGAYMWDGDQLLQGDLSPLERAMSMGIGALRISFTARGMEDILRGRGRKALLGALDRARQMGIAVELCLGDPWWITQEGRYGLVNLVSSLKNLPFDGLHLDLEPDQLQGVTQDNRSQLMAETLRTVQEVAKVSPWEISMAIHPRYLEGDLLPVTLGLLREIPLRDVTCMIYVSRVSAVSRRMQAISLNTGDIPLSLAVSVERSMPEGESFYRVGRRGFLGGVLPEVGTSLAGRIRGIWIQSLEDLFAMPEGGSVN